MVMITIEIVTTYRIYWLQWELFMFFSLLAGLSYGVKPYRTGPVLMPTSKRDSEKTPAL